MKSNLPSPRFLHEFDTIDTLAMRNISEKRKLQQQLREFDKQLHSNLVRMESEILSIRLENSESTPATLIAKQKDKENNNVNKGKIMGDVKGNSREKAKSDSQKQERNGVINSSEAIQTMSSYNILPKIITTSYLTAKHEEFDENKDGDAKLSDKSSSLETISEMGQKQQQAEQRILMSLQRPRSQLQVLPGTIGRPPTPQASSHLLSPLGPVDQQRRASSHGLLAPLSNEYETKGRTIRALSAPDVSELLRSDLGRLKSLPYSPGTESPSKNRLGNLRILNKQKLSVLGDVNGLEKNGVKVCVTNENSSPKSEQKIGLKASLAKAHETRNRESKTPTFDDVMKRRLQLLENGVPEREELETIRYLRLRDEHKNTSDVGDVFAHLHQNNND